MWHGAKWERSRNRYGLWIGTERIAFIGKEFRGSTWGWGIDVAPYTCGEASCSRDAKKAIIEELERVAVRED